MYYSSSDAHFCIGTRAISISCAKLRRYYWFTSRLVLNCRGALIQHARTAKFIKLCLCTVRCSNKQVRS